MASATGNNAGVLGMAEEIRDLIEKINEEGIRAAEEKARQIEDETNRKARETLASARRQAEEMLAAAKERVRQEDERERALLAQAGRDLLLSLREEIVAMLGRVVVSDTRRAMTPEALSTIIVDVARDYRDDGSTPVVVLLKKTDQQALEEHFIRRLSDELKKDIALRPADGLSGGFLISFDNEHTYFDFSDKALADYIGTCLKPRLSRILGDAGKE